MRKAGKTLQEDMLTLGEPPSGEFVAVFQSTPVKLDPNIPGARILGRPGGEAEHQRGGLSRITWSFCFFLRPKRVDNVFLEFELLLSLELTWKSNPSANTEEHDLPRGHSPPSC